MTKNSNIYIVIPILLLKMVIMERMWEIMDITEKEIYVSWHDFAIMKELDM